MSEPTAEQIAAQRERAHEIMSFFKYSCGTEAHGMHMPICLGVATALARVRIEAHAAGRDEGLEAAAKIAGDCGDVDCGCQLPIAHAIRALRGRG